jgi:hypothetical protein
MAFNKDNRNHWNHQFHNITCMENHCIKYSFSFQHGHHNEWFLTSHHSFPTNFCANLQFCFWSYLWLAVVKVYLTHTLCHTLFQDKVHILESNYKQHTHPLYILATEKLIWYSRNFLFSIFYSFSPRHLFPRISTDLSGMMISENTAQAYV